MDAGHRRVPETTKKSCRNCRQRTADDHGHRGLCRTCWNEPEVREKYLTQFEEMRRGKPRCRHCRVRAGQAYLRGLCKPCFRTPSVLKKYPLRAQAVRRKPPPCHHCGLPATRPRGLCWQHYHDPAVRDLYPSTSKYARRGAPDSNGQGKPCAATAAPPGSVDKVTAMAERVRLGQALFSPLDAPADGAPAPPHRRTRPDGKRTG
jgi:hypothetical protein